MDNLIENKIIGFPIIQNQQDFVIAKFSIEQIFTFTKYTSRILNSFDENGKPLYNEEIQREIEKSRVNKIADFLIEDPEATFPTNLVLHIPKEAIEKQIAHKEFVEIRLKQLIFDEIKKEKGDVYITIIDGQHRVKGIEIALDRIVKEIDDLGKTLRTTNEKNELLEQKLKDRVQRLNDLKKIELIVSFFIDKTIEYQAMIFSTINRTQKRVSQSLVYDLFGLDTGDTPQKTAIQIIIVLNGHKKSPFYNRIKFYGGDYSKDNSPPLTQATMAKSIVFLISENLRESERDRYKKRKELKTRTTSSKKFLPFRKYYSNNEDNKISDILFYYFSAVRTSFKDDTGLSYWDFSDNNFKPQNIFHTTVGYEALLKILVDIFQKEQNIDITSSSFFENILLRCNHLEINNTVRYTFNNIGKKILYLDMNLCIWPHNSHDLKDKRVEELKKLTENT